MVDGAAARVAGPKRDDVDPGRAAPGVGGGGRRALREAGHGAGAGRPGAVEDEGAGALEGAGAGVGRRPVGAPVGGARRRPPGPPPGPPPPASQPPQPSLPAPLVY